MSGNVWEWTHSLLKNYPYQAGDGREAEKASGNRVLRGGSWVDYNRYARCACRSDRLSDANDALRGFRLVASPSLL
jgi:formylglycine-generating enzyme required for sulfatase activity